MNNTIQLIARVFLAQMFLLAAFGKLGDAAYAGTQGYMEAMGVPGMLLPLVIALEIGGAALIIAGWQTRWSALALAGFTLVAAAIFHNDFADQMQFVMFLKNVAIAGGLLLLAVHGPGAWSLDGYRAGGKLASGHA